MKTASSDFNIPASCPHCLTVKELKIFRPDYINASIHEQSSAFIYGKTTRRAKKKERATSPTLDFSAFSAVRSKDRSS
ncbi:hypothetical protein N7530_000119 [Penicillium desertorum]|uniref:Uncharacterized protein n=1 Tax=Penicillium desertorum TaxID=1303715 RepID=A0A9X0BV36_9EURO|nr:hypothetical protein N7530_000119 [Penicillium desertorum]